MLLIRNIVPVALWLFGIASSFLVENGIRHVQTKYGEIVGHVEIIHFDGRNVPVARFLGIPYAEAPVGDLRLEKPLPISKLHSPFSAHSFGPSCIQDDRVQPNTIFSEDCLYLNIYSPTNAGRPGQAPKPVLVWIHGGGFISGDSNLYEGDALSAYTDVIVVTFNYRLGPLGFFSLHDDYARGNYGVWDQHTALQWVKDNIADFGGDGDSITIFGESAGAGSVIFQMMYPGNKGLFQRAIAESGSVSPWAITTKELNYNSSVTFANTLGCNNTSHAELMLCLRTKSTSAVKMADKAVQHITQDFVHPSWVPVYDDYFVISDPAKILDSAAETNITSKYNVFREVDLMLGTNSYDGGVYMALLFNTPNIYQTLTERDFETKDIPTLIEFVYKNTPSTAKIDAVVKEYKNAPNHDSIVQSLLQATTDVVFEVPAVKTAHAHAIANKSNTFVYQFSTSPPKSLFPLPLYMSNNSEAADHFDEILYVFGFPSSIGRELLNISYPIGARDMNISKYMMTMWTNFARSGDPNTPANLQQFFDVSWPQFTLSDPLFLDIVPQVTQQSVKRDFARRAVDFWNSLSHV